MSEEEDKPKPEGEQQQRAREKELLTEMLKLTMELVELAKSEKDWEEIEEEFEGKEKHLKQVEVEWQELHKLLETNLSKEMEVFQANRLLAIAVEDRRIRMREKLSENRQKELDNIVERGDLLAGKVFQVEMLRNLEEMLSENYKSSAEGRKASIKNSVPIVQQQAETTNILEKVRENTSTWRQFGLLLLAAFAGAILTSLVSEIFIPLFKMWLGLDS